MLLEPFSLLTRTYYPEFLADTRDKNDLKRAVEIFESYVGF